jgi:hypothetical protein
MKERLEGSVLFVSTQRAPLLLLSSGATTPTLPKGHRLAFTSFKGSRGSGVSVIAAVPFIFSRPPHPLGVDVGASQGYVRGQKASPANLRKVMNYEHQTMNN